MKLAEKISQNSANSSNRKIALFGGSFDPITRGHQCVIDIILKNNIVDEIWLLPCYRHLFGKQLTSDAHRLNMLNIAVKDYKNVFVIDYEIEKKLQGSTYGLILSLRSEPGTDIYGFSVIIGLDNALCIKKWHNFEKLVHMAQFITMHRPGIIEDPQINWYLKSPHIFINDKALINCSSTIVRETIKNSDPCLIKNLLNEAVYDYIIDNKLYRYKDTTKRLERNLAQD
jgi:nicotinate-nucleotide adenylyltransferase